MNKLPTRSSLRQGQSLWIYAETGVTVLNARGTLQVVAAPQWLGDQIYQRDILLREGDTHRVERAGWIKISARDEAAVLILPAGRIAVSTFASVTTLLRMQLAKR